MSTRENGIAVSLSLAGSYPSGLFNSLCLVAALASLFLTVSNQQSRASDFECPEINDLLTTTTQGAVDALLPKGSTLDQPSELLTAARLLREHGMSAGSAINHLIALYCPTIAAEIGLTAAQKDDRVRSFAKNATKIVLQGNSVEDIIYDVSLRPDVAEKATDLATQSGVSVEKWIAKLVEKGVE